MKNKVILAVAIIAVLGSFAFNSGKKETKSSQQFTQTTSTTAGYAFRD